MDLLAEFFSHNSMMNTRLLDACRDLSSDQIATTVEGTYGTIGATLVHVANSQVSYAASVLVTERPARLAEDPYPGFEAVADRLALGNELLEQAVTRVDDAPDVTVSGDDPVGSWTMSAALFLLQAINHATEHRSQIATILTQLGVEPPSMDGWTFFFDAGHMADVADPPA